MRYERHLFICTNRRDPDATRGCCASKGSAELRARLKEMVKEAGLKSVVRVNASGCLDACEFGPVAVSYPAGRWYGELSREDCEDLFRSEIERGEALERRLIQHSKFNGDSPDG